MKLIPSRKLSFESKLEPTTFLQKLKSCTEPHKSGFKLGVRKDFEGEIFEDGSFHLTFRDSYSRGMRVNGTVSACRDGSSVRMSIHLPRMTQAFGLSFGWGTFIILLAGTSIIIVDKTHASIAGIMKVFGIISMPLLLAYGIMVGGLWQGVGTIKEYFEENFR